MYMYAALTPAVHIGTDVSLHVTWNESYAMSPRLMLRVELTNPIREQRIRMCASCVLSPNANSTTSHWILQVPECTKTTYAVYSDQYDLLTEQENREPIDRQHGNDHARQLINDSSKQPPSQNPQKSNPSQPPPQDSAA